MARPGISDRLAVLLFSVFLIVLVISAAHASAAGVAGGGSAVPEPSRFIIRLFTPEAGSINSVEIKDATNGRSGEVIFATAFGLSTFSNGTWTTRHITRDNVSRGLLDDYITAVEMDPSGNLWIGYPGGLQIFDGATYQTIRNQQVLKSLRVKALQRWDDTMWVATGNAGIHRYRNGDWQWFQPYAKGGPGFFEADSMALDPFTDTLFIATEREGIWEVPSPSDPVAFRLVEPSGNPPVDWHARQDPLGGVYFFSDDTVRKYAKKSWTTVLTTGDLTKKTIAISDIAAAHDGALYVGTDDGIFVWQDGAVLRHLGRFEGTGTSFIITYLFADAKNRIWFATQDDAGYYLPEEPKAPLPVVLINQSPADVTPTVTATTPLPAITGTPPPTIATPAVVQKEPSLLERLQALFAELSGRFRK